LLKKFGFKMENVVAEAKSRLRNTKAEGEHPLKVRASASRAESAKEFQAVGSQ